jgi:V8-like Glu-specific endopeptidase
MPRLYRFIQSRAGARLALCLLVIGSLVYTVAVNRFLYTSVFAPSANVVDHAENANASAVLRHWTTANMLAATEDNADEQIDNAATVTQGGPDINAGKAAQQQGQAPNDGNPLYPLSTVGKIFFTRAGQDYVCSGTAVVSNNHNTVDTAGHCLYWSGSWSRNLIFCPLYDRGSTPYGCWVAHDLEVPADWIDAKPNDLHHDLGMAIVSPNDEGNLTDVVGGAGWAYNQSTNLLFSAYGYPAARPFDGQTRQSCEERTGRSWQHAGGTVVSIPCNMTGGSSGGPWFIKMDGNWYLDGHNDFTSSIQPGHMFSPYYDDTWSALYNKAQNA